MSTCLVQFVLYEHPSLEINQIELNLSVTEICNTILTIFEKIYTLSCLLWGQHHVPLVIGYKYITNNETSRITYCSPLINYV